MSFSIILFSNGDQVVKDDKKSYDTIKWLLGL